MKEVYMAAKALIFIDKKFLIIKRGSNEDVYAEEWDIPGGKVKFGENPIESLKREVKEEAGIQIDVKKPIDIWTFFKNKGKTQVIGVTFLCNFISGDVALGKEHIDFRWISPNEIGNYKIHEGIKATLNKLKN